MPGADKEFKRAHAKDSLSRKETLRLEKEGLADLNQSHWGNSLSQCLKALGKTEQDIASDRFSAEWKLAVATRLKELTSARNGWLSDSLNMGVARGVSSNCGLYSKRKGKCPLYAKLCRLNFDV